MLSWFWLSRTLESIQFGLLLVRGFVETNRHTAWIESCLPIMNHSIGESYHHYSQLFFCRSAVARPPPPPIAVSLPLPKWRLNPSSSFGYFTHLINFWRLLPPTLSKVFRVGLLVDWAWVNISWPYPSVSTTQTCIISWEEEPHPVLFHHMYSSLAKADSCSIVS